MKQDSIFAKVVKLCALIGCTLCALFAVLYRYFEYRVLLSLAITAGTTGYHFVMRLLVGWLVARCVRKPLDPDSFRFRQRNFERKLYRTLRVRRWKGQMPTYNPHEFSIEENTPEQIIQNSCKAELVHEWIVAASFLPTRACRSKSSTCAPRSAAVNAAAIPDAPAPMIPITIVSPAFFPLLYDIFTQDSRKNFLAIPKTCGIIVQVMLCSAVISKKSPRTARIKCSLPRFGTK